MRALCQASNLVISTVTASNTLSLVEEAAPDLRLGTVFLDLNSASPGTKQHCAPPCWSKVQAHITSRQAL